MPSWSRYTLLLLLCMGAIASAVEVPLDSFVPESRWPAAGITKMTEEQRKALAAEFQRVHLEGYASGTRSPASSRSTQPAPAPGPGGENPIDFLAIRSTVENGVKRPYIASTHASKRISYVVERRKQGYDNSPAVITGQLEPQIVNTLGDASYAAGKVRYPYLYRILTAQFVP